MVVAVAPPVVPDLCHTRFRPIERTYYDGKLLGFERGIQPGCR